MIGIHDTVIHSSTEANFSAFSYSQVVIGADTSVVINGKLMTLVGGTTFPVKVTNISGGTSVYVIGSHINVFDNVSSDGTYKLP